MRRIFVRLIAGVLCSGGIVLAGCDSAPSSPNKTNVPVTPTAKPTEPGKPKLPVDPG